MIKINSKEFAQGEVAFIDDFSLSESISNKRNRKLAILGGSGINRASEYYQKATELAKSISKAGISVITGGGSGIMEAGNKGAKSANSNAMSYGLKVKTIKQEANAENNYIDENCRFVFNTLSVRLLTIISVSDAVTFFPGGFGTLEELFSLLIRIKLDMMKKIPIYLFGSKFWEQFFSWLENVVKNEEAIEESDLKLFKIEDDVETISNEIISHCASLT